MRFLKTSIKIEVWRLPFWKALLQVFEPLQKHHLIYHPWWPVETKPLVAKLVFLAHSYGDIAYYWGKKNKNVTSLVCSFANTSGPTYVQIRHCVIQGVRYSEINFTSLKNWLWPRDLRRNLIDSAHKNAHQMRMKYSAKGYLHGKLFMTSNWRSILTSLHIRMYFIIAFQAHLTSIFYVLNV